MRLHIAALITLFAMSKPVHAQRYYTWEEACRLGGQTTGACAPKSQQPEQTQCVPLAGSAFHAEKSNSSGCINVALSPSVDAEILVELIGLANAEKINSLNLTIWRSPGLRNAVAMIRGGTRMIVVDPQWSATISAESYLVFGHEIGHHFCGHTLGNSQLSPHELELEADRFSGASIKRFEAYHGRRFFDDALRAATQLYSVSGSRSHPPRAARLEAIQEGYTRGSKCGSLAPGMQGYSPNPR